MNLVRRVDEVKFTTSEHLQAYGEHDTLKTEPVKMQLQDGAQPYAVHSQCYRCKCRERVNASVWWPGLSVDINNIVNICKSCQEQKRAQQKETLISTPLPDRPLKRIALDLCEHNKHNYLGISDYYSRYLEILQLPSTSVPFISNLYLSRDLKEPLLGSEFLKRWCVTMVPNSPVQNSGSWHSGWTSDTSRLVLTILKETVMQKEQYRPLRESFARKIS